jgi:hypothetical protein
MPENIFAGLFDTPITSVIDVNDFLICVFAAIILGIILAAAFSVKARFTKSFVTTLAIIPAIVCVVIMMVNGNIGAGVAVAGAFSLVRFRSAPGTAREIAAIFLAMGTGLICGMGYIAFAVLFTLILGALFALYNLLDLGTSRRMAVRKSLRITIPEDLDYTTVFDDLFAEYTKDCQLVRVKTVNMGSMFRLTYDVILRDAKREKEFIDRLRERNGNLEIMVSREEMGATEL